MYDITPDKFRIALIKQLRKAGFYRIQKSVFLGSTTIEKIKKLEDFFNQNIEENEDSKDRFIIIPLDENILKKIKLININIDLALYLGRKAVHFV